VASPLAMPLIHNVGREKNKKRKGSEAKCLTKLRGG